jgi:hypothetical protein
LSKGYAQLRNSTVTGKTIKGKYEIANKIEEGLLKESRRPLAPGMEDVLSGYTLGQYRLMERLGRGGMATVYKAYQLSLDRYVAVKVLSTFLAQDPDFAARFQREAQAIAKLNHPNILSVHDYGQEGELIYIVMRYVEGGTLQDMLGRPLDLDTTVEIIAQMGEALEHAHQRGIVHRDVKPSNILMADGNWALLSDFGLAKVIGASTRITKTGMGIGTPTYIAPEQARGTGIDARSDIYSLSIVLFEMLTGQVPFEGDSSLVVLFKHLTAPPPPPREINPDIPKPVEWVLLKALAKDPVDRFQRPREMVTALQKAVAGEPVVTTVISLAEKKRRQQEKKLAASYAEAVGFLEAKEWQKALEKWIEVQALEPGYPDSKNVATKAKRELAKLGAAALPADPKPPAKEEPVPIWRKMPVWVWAAIGGAALLVTVIAGATSLFGQGGTPEPASVVTGATTLTMTVASQPASLTADSELPAVVPSTSTPPPSTPTPLLPTATPVPPTATATHTLTPPMPAQVPTAVPQPAGPTALTIYFRDTRTETGFVALSSDQVDGGMIYEEGKFVYGEAAVQIGDTVYHFDKPKVGSGEPKKLPDPWQVQFEFAEELVARTGNEAGFDPKKARFWVGTLDASSAVGGDNPYSLIVKVYEGDELRESLQVLFSVADVPESGGGGPGEGGDKPLRP